MAGPYPKPGRPGATRLPGIHTVCDRVAVTAAKPVLEPVSGTRSPRSSSRSTLTARSPAGSAAVDNSCVIAGTKDGGCNPGAVACSLQRKRCRSDDAVTLVAHGRARSDSRGSNLADPGVSPAATRRRSRSVDRCLRALVGVAGRCAGSAG
jgi:hypothetical protein